MVFVQIKQSQKKLTQLSILLCLNLISIYVHSVETNGAVPVLAMGSSVETTSVEVLLCDTLACFKSHQTNTFSFYLFPNLATISPQAFILPKKLKVLLVVLSYLNTS